MDIILEDGQEDFPSNVEVAEVPEDCDAVEINKDPVSPASRYYVDAFFGAIYFLTQIRGSVQQYKSVVRALNNALKVPLREYCLV